MGKRIAVLVTVTAGLLWAVPAQAAGDAPWTVESGKTMGTGQTAFWGEAGFPGVWLQLVHGIDAQTDIGGRFAFNYAAEGVVNGCCTVGLDFQLLLRRNFFDNGKMFIAGTFDPGLQLYFPTGTTVVGIKFPLGVQFGFPVSPVFTVNATFDLAMYVNFSSYSGLVPAYLAVPILFGGGFEYLAQRNLALTFQLKLGPTIFTLANSNAQFTLYLMVGVAYKF